MIAFVASNPSHLGPDSPAKKVFYKWTVELGLSELEFLFMNVSHVVTPANRPLKRSEFELTRLEADLVARRVAKIVALGNTASSALDALHRDYFKLPHPSPRNRLLNDRVFVANQLLSCKTYLGII